MKRRLSYLLLCAGLLGAAALTALTVPASAEKRTITVRLLNGQVVTVTVDVAPGTPLSQIVGIGGAPVAPGTPTTPTPQGPTPAAPAPQPGAGVPQLEGGGDKTPAKKQKNSTDEDEDAHQVVPEAPTSKPRPRKTPLRNSDGSPTPSNPGFMDALPGPSFTTGVPNFVIRKFRVPIFLLPIYQAAGIQYGVRWEILAAINEIETDYGRNLNVSSAGALGWMQFIPSSWRAYGVDANKDGKKDPYNPVDAIFAAARYLKAAGYEKDVRRSVFAYNHADWYVDSVMLRARLIAGVPADLVGSLTGLTEGRFPVAARARYADDLKEREATKRVKRGQNAANVIHSRDDRRSIEIFARQGSPVVATNDGQVKKIGTKRGIGRYVVIQDVYGNRYMYSNLGSVAKYYPVPKEDADSGTKDAKALKANAGDKSGDAKPASPASAGRQPDKADDSDDAPSSAPKQTASIPVKERLFAHPDIPGAREAGGLEQLLDSKLKRDGGFETYKNYFSRPFGADSKDVRLRRLKVGSKVIGGTILGRVGKPGLNKASNIDFEIRRAGKGAPRIDPKPILDGWKLLEATAVYRASGKNVLYGEDGESEQFGLAVLAVEHVLARGAVDRRGLQQLPAVEDRLRVDPRRTLARRADLEIDVRRLVQPGLAYPAEDRAADDLRPDLEATQANVLRVGAEGPREVVLVGLKAAVALELGVEQLLEPAGLTRTRDVRMREEALLHGDGGRRAWARTRRVVGIVALSGWRPAEAGAAGLASPDLSPRLP